jgi:uncharacterized protein
MRLVGMAAGKTRTIEIRGSQVPTAYLKTSITGRCYVHESGLDGNETAVHPDALYAIASEHYEYWAARLGADRATWSPGHFAENLTISGLDESALRIGDIVAIGPEVELIVAGPRIPCFKLAWRMDQSDPFIREFGLSGHSGVYFGVRRPGWLEIGMAVTVIHPEPEHPTVAELARLVLDCPRPPEETIRMLLGLSYLSKSSALVLRSVLMRVIDEGAQPARWKDWRDFTVTGTVVETPDVMSFTLKPTDGGPLPRVRAGQFVAVQVPTQDGGSVTRPWSLSDHSENPSSLRITVKREASGLGSSRLHAIAREGASLQLRAPCGRFVLDRSTFMPVVLIGAGIGITPLLAMAKAHLSRGEDAPPLKLFHCVRSGDAHPLRPEIDALAATNPSLAVHYFYSRPTARDLEARQFHRTGHLSVDDVIAGLDGASIVLGSKRVPVPWFESDFYICGPESFESMLVSGLTERGARRHRIFVERFHSTGDLSEHGSTSSAEVIFARSGSSAVWTEGEGLTLLELAEKSGLAPPSGCRIGVCSSCQCELLEGEVRYDFRPIADIPKGSALLCCSRPATARVVISV